MSLSIDNDRACAPWLTLVLAAGCGLLAAAALAYSSSAPGKASAAVIAGMGALALVAVLASRPAVLTDVVLFALAMTLSLSIKAHLAFRAEHIGGAIGYRISVTEVLACLLLFSFWLRMQDRTRWKLSLDRPITISFAVYFGIAAVSALAARDVELGLFQLAALLQAFALFAIVSNILVTEHRLSIFVAGLLVGLALQSTAAIVQVKMPGGLNLEFAGGREASEETNSEGAIDLPETDLGTTVLQGEVAHRPTGMLIHPNVLGLYLALTIPLAIAVWLSAASRMMRIAAGGALGLSFVALYWSMSRSAWAAIVLAMILCAFWGWRLGLRLGRVETAVVVVALVVSVALGAAKANTIVDRIRGTAGEAMEFRLTLARAALGMLHDHPALGVGLNNFVQFVEEYDPTGMSHYKCFPVHTLVLLEASETGVFGGLAFVVLIVVTTRRGLQFARRAPTLELRLLGSFLVAGIVGFWVAELSGFVYRIPVMTSYVWCCLGLLASLPRVQRELRP